MIGVKMSNKANELVMLFGNSCRTSFKDAMVCLEWDIDKFNKLDNYIHELEKKVDSLETNSKKALDEAFNHLEDEDGSSYLIRLKCKKIMNGG